MACKIILAILDGLNHELARPWLHPLFRIQEDAAT
jgi:hypothetical protein